MNPEARKTAETPIPSGDQGEGSPGIPDLASLNLDANDISDIMDALMHRESNDRTRHAEVVGWCRKLSARLDDMLGTEDLKDDISDLNSKIDDIFAIVDEISKAQANTSAS